MNSRKLPVNHSDYVQFVNDLFNETEEFYSVDLYYPDGYDFDLYHENCKLAIDFIATRIGDLVEQVENQMEDNYYTEHQYDEAVEEAFQEGYDEAESYMYREIDSAAQDAWEEGYKEGYNIGFEDGVDSVEQQKV